MENKRPVAIKRVKFSSTANLIHKANIEDIQQQCCTNYCGQKIDQLKETVSQLQKSVVKLEGSVSNLELLVNRHNIAIMEALAAQKVLTEKLLGKQKEAEGIRHLFPVETVEALGEANQKINEANRSDFVRCLMSLIRGRLSKTLTEIFSVSVILDSNIDGIHGKHALKKYSLLFAALMEAIRGNGEKDPEKSLRNALKLNKKRHFQAVCLQNKKILEDSIN